MDNNSNTFTIRPMGRDLSLKAGEQATGTVTVSNQQDSVQSFSFTASVAPYGVRGEGYEADLVTDGERTLLAKWITIDNPTGTLAPNESAEISYTIDVPQNAPGGGQYAAILVSSTIDSGEESDDSSMVKYVYEMASILYADVEGETVHSGAITSHSVPAFSTTSKIATTAQIENTGNTHEYAKISLTVTDFFSGEEIATSEESDMRVAEVILPSTERQLINNLDNLPTLGIITVKESIEYLGEDSTIEQRVIICPLWFLLLLAFTLVSIVAVIINRVRSARDKLPEDKSAKSGMRL